MLKRFINPAYVTMLLVVGGCASMPLPLVDDGAAPAVNPDTEIVLAPGESLQTQDPSGQIVHAVPTPPLQAGNQALFDRALELLKNNEYAAARVLFEELTASQPELAGPWVNIGFIHLAQNAPDEARAAFEQALQANPSNCDAHNQLGVMARRAGRFAEAEQHYLSCLEAHPGYSHARLNLGILYELYLGRLGEALAAYHDYQANRAEPDTRVDGWVMDLERRVAAIARR